MYGWRRCVRAGPSGADGAGVVDVPHRRWTPARRIRRGYVEGPRWYAPGPRGVLRNHRPASVSSRTSSTAAPPVRRAGVRESPRRDREPPSVRCWRDPGRRPVPGGPDGVRLPSYGEPLACSASTAVGRPSSGGASPGLPSCRPLIWTGGGPACRTSPHARPRTGAFAGIPRSRTDRRAGPGAPAPPWRPLMMRAARCGRQSRRRPSRPWLRNSTTAASCCPAIRPRRCSFPWLRKKP